MHDQSRVCVCVGRWEFLLEFMRLSLFKESTPLSDSFWWKSCDEADIIHSFNLEILKSSGTTQCEPSFSVMLKELKHINKEQTTTNRTPLKIVTLPAKLAHGNQCIDHYVVGCSKCKIKKRFFPNLGSGLIKSMLQKNSKIRKGTNADCVSHLKGAHPAS